MKVLFRVDDTPIAKPRMTQRDKYFPRKCVSQYWTWADRVRWAGQQSQVWQGWVFTKDPLKLTCHFALPIPASWPEKKRASAALSEIAHTSKPDIKNLIAGIEDALNNVLYVDDSQIVMYGEPSKYYAPDPGALICLEVVTAPAALDAALVTAANGGEVKRFQSKVTT